MELETEMKKKKEREKNATDSGIGVHERMVKLAPGVRRPSTYEQEVNGRGGRRENRKREETVPLQEERQRKRKRE